MGSIIMEPLAMLVCKSFNWPVLTGQNDIKLPYHVRTRFPRDFWRDYWSLFFNFVLEVPKLKWDMLGFSLLGFPYMSMHKQRGDFICYHLELGRQGKRQKEDLYEERQKSDLKH